MTHTLSRSAVTRTLTALALTLIPLTIAARAQTPDTSSPDCSQLTTHEERTQCAILHAETRTFYLKNAASQNDANEVMVAIRNVSDISIKLYLIASQDAIIVTTYPQEMARVEAVIHALDRPRKAYRLTFTLTELEGNNTISTQHVSVDAVIGQRTNLKQGQKIPIATGVSGENSNTQTQFTYLDIGTNFDLTITQQADGVNLESKIEESSVGTPQTIMGVTEPVIRQTVLQGTSLLTLDKPVMLGSIDVPGSTHRFDIAVVLQPIK